MRLLARDLPLLSQVLLRLLYLAPLTVFALRAAATHAGASLPGVVGALTFMAGQAAGSLAWVTLSAEDAPDLIAASPAAPRVIRRAKMAAAVAPVGALLAAPLLIMVVLSPLAGAAAMTGCAAAAIAGALINSWRASPAKRSDFRRRRQASWVVGLAEFLICALIALAAGLTAASWLLLAIIPTVLAAVALGALSRDDAQIAGARG